MRPSGFSERRWQHGKLQHAVSIGAFLTAAAGYPSGNLPAQATEAAQHATSTNRTDSLAQIASLTAAVKNSRDAREHYQLGVLAASATKGLRDGSIVRDPTLIGIMRIAEQALGRATELDPQNAEYALALAAYYSEAAATGPTERYASRAFQLARW
jgi:hypothetical protein